MNNSTIRNLALGAITLGNISFVAVKLAPARSSTDLAQFVHASADHGTTLQIRPGLPTLVLTIDLATKQGIDSIQRARAASERFNVVLVMPRGGDTSRVDRSGFVDTVQVPGDVGGPALGLPDARWNAWYVFDSEGRLATYNRLTAGGLDAAVGVEGGSVSGRGGFEEQTLHALRRSASIRQYLSTPATGGSGILFVAKAGTTCASGSLLAAAREMLRSRPDVRLTIMVPSDWGEGDLRSFAATFGEELPVATAPIEFNNSWTRLKALYGDAKAGTFLVVALAGQPESVHTDAKEISQWLLRPIG